MAAKTAYCADPRSAFLAVLNAAGIAEKNIVIDRIVRLDGPDDRKGQKSAWYIYREFPAGDGVIGVADFGSWKTDFKDHWTSKADHAMTTGERLSYYTARDAMKLAQDLETAYRHDDAAKAASDEWLAAAPALGHDYLTRKGIKPMTGLRIAKDGRLIVPMAINNMIVSLQYIAADGTKRFKTGGRTKGAHFRIDGTERVVYVAEGLATATSVFEATGATVYIAFSSHNLYETAVAARADFPYAIVIVAGDNDGNGSKKAEQAALAIKGEAMFPPGHKDFNDFHAAAGLAAVTDFFNPKIEVYSKSAIKPTSENSSTVGVISDIVNYYNATSGNNQPGFAMQAALAVCSIILSRSYKTDYENYASVFLLNIGKSGTGKEHAKTVVEKILRAANMGYLIAGDGYTSAGAVFSALLDRPRHISVIDEFGRYLEAGRDLGKGNHHQREANTKLMECIGRAHSVIRPPSYSTMTMKKADADTVKNRMVYNPAITLLGMTTPDTLFKTLDMGAIRDGFVNRFIISISDAERAVRQHKPPLDVPQRIVDWINAVTERHGKSHIGMDESDAIALTFTQDAINAQNDFQQYCVDQANYLERFGMAELPGRSNEMAMRLALICALSENPNATEVNQRHMKWGIDYIKACLEKTIEKLKVSISSSEFEGAKKEILADLRNRKEDGMTWSAMQKNAPYSRHKQKDLKEILQALKDADLACDEPYTSTKGGRPTVKWIALK
jgi:phage/plasmid primase-like uncharacterized protein